jgi:hypothetical protein
VIDARFSKVGEDVGSRLPVTLPDQVGAKVGADLGPEVTQSLLGAEPVEAAVVPAVGRGKKIGRRFDKITNLPEIYQIYKFTSCG